MEPDLFKNLPPEIITEIFLRLPVVSIPISKCVCKRWLHLLEPDDFVKSHFARSTPALIVLGDSRRLKVMEFEGEFRLHRLTQNDFPYHSGSIISCVNGFLVLKQCGNDALKLCVYNPITREVIKLAVPSDPEADPKRIPKVSAFGFGASKITGRYKAVCIKRRSYDDKLEFHVYTLGTGSWRRLEGHPYVNQFDRGAFVNGNLHWIVAIGEASWISCFDLETECFSFFKTPPHHAQGLPIIRGRSISALSGCLCFCQSASEYEDDSGRYEVTMWIMKEYGVDESWSKEYVIPLDHGICYFDPVKVFENGDLLILLRDICLSRRLFYYSNKNKTMRRIDLFGAGEASGYVDCGFFTPTLVSLKTLGLGVENVISL